MITQISKKVNADGCHIGQLDNTVVQQEKILKKKL